MKKEAGKSGFLATLGIGRKAYAREHEAAPEEISAGDVALWSASSTTAASLLSSGNRQARPRQLIYDKWAQMEGDPIVSTALSLLCTAALGGDSASGQMVYLEPSARAREDKRLETVCEEIGEALTDALNRVAFELAYTGAAFGDAYARIYAERGHGVVAVQTDELMRPPLVQPFERAGRTVGCFGCDPFPGAKTLRLPAVCPRLVSRAGFAMPVDPVCAATARYWDALRTVLADLDVSDAELTAITQERGSSGLKEEQIRMLHARAYAGSL